MPLEKNNPSKRPLLVALECPNEENRETFLESVTLAFRNHFQLPEVLGPYLIDNLSLFHDEKRMKRVEGAVELATRDCPHPKEDLVDFGRRLALRFNWGGHSDRSAHLVFDTGLIETFQLKENWGDDLSFDKIRYVRNLAIGVRPDVLLTFGLEALPASEKMLWLQETGTSTLAEKVTHVPLGTQREVQSRLTESLKERNASTQTPII